MSVLRFKIWVPVDRPHQPAAISELGTQILSMAPNA